MPDLLELFTHPGCISREDGKQLVESVLKDFPQVAFREVNIIAEQKRAQQVGVQMSPTLVYNGKIMVVGIPGEQKALWLLLKEKTYVQS